MRTLVHVSDLHFGAIEPAVAEAALRDVARLSPTLVVVSGDLTQRARPTEFRAARRWLDRLPCPWLAVPGNHDIPLFDVVRRFLRPLRRYRRLVTPELAPSFVDDEIAVLGVNTARSLTWKEGRISVEQFTDLRERLCGLPDDRLKVLVTHHPFVPPPHDPQAAVLGRGGRAQRALESCGVALLLAGHLHVGGVGEVGAYHAAVRRSILSVQAGTLSRRLRDHPNGYNRIVADPPRLVVEARAWDGGGFAPRERDVFVRESGRWQVKDGDGGQVAHGGPSR